MSNDAEFRSWLLEKINGLLKCNDTPEAAHVRERLSFNPSLNSAPLGELLWAYGFLKWKGQHLIAGRKIEFWEAMAFFLAKERKRHEEDIKEISEDLRKLYHLGIGIPEADLDLFVEIPKI